MSETVSRRARCHPSVAALALACLMGASHAAEIQPLRESFLDAIFSQDSFGASPIDIRFNPGGVIHNADWRTIDLKVVVAPALRREPKPDPLFIFEGGPGGGAATLAPQRIPMFRHFQTDRDIVLIDQRGTGDSNPLDCAADDDRPSAHTAPSPR